MFRQFATTGRRRETPALPAIGSLGLSPTEMMALSLSRQLLKPLDGTEIQAALSSALNKVAAALPPPAHDYVCAMEDIFSVGLGLHKKYAEHRKTIDLIARAIDRRRSAQLCYYSASRLNTTRREVDPYFLRQAFLLKFAATGGALCTGDNRSGGWKCFRISFLA